MHQRQVFLARIPFNASVNAGEAKAEGYFDGHRRCVNKVKLPCSAEPYYNSGVAGLRPQGLGNEGNTLTTGRYTPSEIIRRGQERYEQDIRAQVEVHRGKMLALDVDSGEYALADDSITAFDRLKAKIPSATVYLMRIGFPAAVHIGAGRRTTQS
jgi:hypothetical protein